MSHSTSSRESSGSPSRKRSRSPASEHSPDSPSLKRRSPSPRQDSAGASPSNRPALPPRLISRRVTRSRSPRHTPPSTRRRHHTPLPPLSPDNALGLNTPDHSLGASTQARPPSPPSHEFTYTADPEHDELLYPNDEAYADAPDDDHNVFIEMPAIYSEEPDLYTQHEDPYYPSAPRSPSTSSNRFAYRNPSPEPRDVPPAPRDPPPAPPAPRSPRSALDAYTFGEPSRALVLEDPVSPRTIPGVRRVEASGPRHGVVPPSAQRSVIPSSAQRGIVPSNAPYTPFYPSPSSQRLRDQVPHWHALRAAGSSHAEQPQASTSYARASTSYAGASTSYARASTSHAPASTSYAAASTSYAAASTSYAPHPGPSYHEPSHYTPRSISRYEPPQASTSQLPPLGPADWIPPPPHSPRPEHSMYQPRPEHQGYPPRPEHPAYPVEDYLLPPIRANEPAASTSTAYPRCGASCTRLVERLQHDIQHAVDDWSRALPVVPEVIQGHGPDCPFRELYVQEARRSRYWQERYEAGQIEVQSATRKQADAEELAEYRRLQFVEIQQAREGDQARIRELEDRDRAREHYVERMAANLATVARAREQGYQEREQDLLRANRSMARQLHANGLVPEIEQVDESASEDEVVTPGGPDNTVGEVTVVDASGPVVEPNTVGEGFTQVEELTPEEAVDFEDDLDYVDDFDADDEFEVTTPVQANVLVEASTPVEATVTTPVQDATPVQATTQVETTTPARRSPAPASSHSTPNLPLAPHPSPVEGPAPRTSESPIPAPSRSTHASPSPRTSPKPASQRSSPRFASPRTSSQRASPRSSPRLASPRTSPRLASPYARPASASSQRSPSPAESSSSRIRPRPFASSMFSVAPHAMRRRLGAHVFRADAAEGRDEEQDEDEPEQDEDEPEPDADEPAIKVEPEEDDRLVVKLEPEEETLPSSRHSSLAPSSRAT
ncbi:hypothetical protein GGF50DRAFT_92144 [Schizophyllum commune]